MKESDKILQKGSHKLSMKEGTLRELKRTIYLTGGKLFRNLEKIY